VLAGGRGRRLGDVDKALLDVAGSTMLERIVAALAPHCDPILVVGPERSVADRRLTFVSEREPGGGPVPAVAAGVEAVPANRDTVVVCAVDFPCLRDVEIGELVASLASRPRADAAAIVDDRGSPNPLLAAYRVPALRGRLATTGRGRRADELLPPRTHAVSVDRARTLNVNTREDLALARISLR
jgi:molybdopterin-guanine dinucleotide biosynthesis protein A